MIDVILTRILSTHQNVRTREVEGITNQLPEVGQIFNLVGEPLDEKTSVRVIVTSPVKEVRHHPEEGSMEFWTENSHYGLQILDMDTEGGVS